MGFRIGIDIGGVIMQRGSDADDTSFFSGNYLRTPAFDSAFEVIRALVDEGHQIWLVSKCGEKVQAKTEEWLTYHNFYKFTGVDLSQVVFTRERKDKLVIAQDLGLTHFIDDRLEILQYMVGTVPHLYLFNPDTDEIAEHAEALVHVRRIANWPDIQRAIAT